MKRLSGIVVVVVVSFAIGAPVAAEESPASMPTPGLFRPIAAGLIAAGCLGASINAFTDHPTGGFHLAHENWFGEHTYAETHMSILESSDVSNTLNGILDTVAK